MSQYLREIRPTLALAVPIIVGQVSQMLMGITDSVMIGRTGTVPLAASAFGGNVFGVFYVVGIGLMIPVAIFVSRARGTGPLLSSLAAIAFLGERPSPLALAGGITIIASIFWLTGGFAKIVQLARGSAPSTAEGSSPYLGAIGYGIGTGAFIAAYTVADRQGVTIGGVQPLILDWGGNVTRTALFAPFAIKRWPEVRAVWRDYKLACFTVAVLGPLAYILVLWALTFTPLTYVAPTREVSILFGAMLGARLLNEGDGHRRLIAAAAMALGVGALALG
jgi:drug/metabolite transporter (DMT)-like permease